MRANSGKNYSTFNFLYNLFYYHLLIYFLLVVVEEEDDDDNEYVDLFETF